MTIFEILEKSASVFPSHLAAIHGDRKISYKDLYLYSTKVGNHISSLNLEKKSRIAILFENSLEYVIAFFAVFKAGHVAVPLDTSLKPERINDILSNCQASAFLVQAKYERLLGDILRKNRSVSFLISEKPLRQTPSGLSAESFDQILDGPFPGVEKPSGEPKVHHPDVLGHDLERESAQAPPELAAIFYTSGSTGSSKGVMLSHRNLIANTIATIQYLNLGPKDSVLVVLPFYYIYGNSLLLTHIMTGGTLVIENRFLYPQLCWIRWKEKASPAFREFPQTL